jgi:hypothetical protein
MKLTIIALGVWAGLTVTVAASAQDDDALDATETDSQEEVSEEPVATERASDDVAPANAEKPTSEAGGDGAAFVLASLREPGR